MSAMAGTVTVRLAGIIPHVTRRLRVCVRSKHDHSVLTVPLFGSSAASGPHRIFRSARVHGDGLLHRKRDFTKTARPVQQRSCDRAKQGNAPGPQTSVPVGLEFFDYSLCEGMCEQATGKEQGHRLFLDKLMTSFCLISSLL